MNVWSNEASANERLKRRDTEIVASSLIVAVLAHLGVVLLMPPIAVADIGQGAPEELIVLEVPEEVVLPDAPKPLDKPARPVPTPDVAADATIEVVGWSEAVDVAPPPRPQAARTSASDAFHFTPYTVAPRLTNASEFQRELLRAYPRVLRDAGVGGVVVMQIHIDAEGRVLQARVGTSSGYDLLDEAALSVADEMRFTGALNGTEKVAVWVQIPLEFRIR